MLYREHVITVRIPAQHDMDYDVMVQLGHEFGDVIDGMKPSFDIHRTITCQTIDVVELRTT